MDRPTDTIEQMAERLANAATHLKSIGAELQAAVDEVKEHPSKAKLKEVAVAYFHLKEAYEAADKALKTSYHPMDHMNKSIIPARMESEGTDQLRVPEVARSFGTRQQLSASFIDKEAGFGWLREIGQGDIITETVNAGTLSSFIRGRILDEGIDPPEDIVRVNTYQMTTITKYAPKGKV